MRSKSFNVLLPYECLFDLRWGFIRLKSGLSKDELFARFTPYCARLTEDLSKLFPTIKEPFKITPDVVRLAPRTAILTLINAMYRQYASDYPDEFVKLNIDLNFAGVEFIPNEIKREIADIVKITMSSYSTKIGCTPVTLPYKETDIKHIRKKYDAVIVYSLQEFVEIYNPNTPKAYDGFGIITRPFFLKSPQAFKELIAKHDPKNIFTGSKIGKGDHYEILTDVFAHLGPIYFHEPEYFSAILPE